MANLITSRTELKAQLKATADQLETMEASLDASVTELASLKETITGKDQEIAEQSVTITTLTAEKESLVAEIAKTSAELTTAEADIEKAENSSEEKANETLAAAGHPPIEEGNTDDRTPREKVIAEYKALPAGPERKKFRRANSQFFSGE